jgi:hypothetical protein
MQMSWEIEDYKILWAEQEKLLESKKNRKSGSKNIGKLGFF